MADVHTSAMLLFGLHALLQMLAFETFSNFRVRALCQ